jgi:hypothetical protein
MGGRSRKHGSISGTEAVAHIFLRHPGPKLSMLLQIHSRHLRASFRLTLKEEERRKRKGKSSNRILHEGGWRKHRRHN